VPGSGARHCLIGTASLSGHRVVVRLSGLAEPSCESDRPRFLPSLLLLSRRVASPSKNPATPSPLLPCCTYALRDGKAAAARSWLCQRLLRCRGERRFFPSFVAGELNPSSSSRSVAPYMGARAGLRLTALVDGVTFLLRMSRSF
jgi:hypothetical protein